MVRRTIPPINISVGSAKNIKILSANPYRKEYRINNTDSEKSVFLGKDKVSSTGTFKGDELIAGQTVSDDLDLDEVYAIAEAGATIELIVWEIVSDKRQDLED